MGRGAVRRGGGRHRRLRVAGPHRARGEDRPGRGPVPPGRAGRGADRHRAARSRLPGPPAHRRLLPQAHRLRPVLRRPHGRLRPGPHHRGAFPAAAARHRGLGAGAGPRRRAVRLALPHLALVGPVRERVLQVPQAARQVPGRGARGAHLLPDGPARRAAGAVHLDVRHRLHRPQRQVPDRSGRVHGRDPQRLLPGRRVQRHRDPVRGRLAGPRAEGVPRVPPGHQGPPRRRRGRAGNLRHLGQGPAWAALTGRDPPT